MKILIRLIVGVYLIRILVANIHLERYFPRYSSFTSPLYFMGDMTKSNWCFAFFTGPSYTSKDIRITFHYADGTTYTSSSQSDPGFFVKNPLNRMRLHSMAQTASIDTLTQQVFVRSWAVRLLNTFPEATHLTIQIIQVPGNPFLQHSNNTSELIFEAFASR